MKKLQFPGEDKNLGKKCVELIIFGIKHSLGKDTAIKNVDAIVEYVQSECIKARINSTLIKCINTCRILKEASFDGYINKEFQTEFFGLGTVLACEMADKGLIESMVTI